jgi:hypothetical protein
MTTACSPLREVVIGGFDESLTPPSIEKGVRMRTVILYQRRNKMFRYLKIRIVCILFDLIVKIMGDHNEHSESLSIHQVDPKSLDRKIWKRAYPSALPNAYKRTNKSFDIVIFTRR